MKTKENKKTLKWVAVFEDDKFFKDKNDRVVVNVSYTAKSARFYFKRLIGSRVFRVEPLSTILKNRVLLDPIL